MKRVRIAGRLGRWWNQGVEKEENGEGENGWGAWRMVESGGWERKEMDSDKTCEKFFSEQDERGREINSGSRLRLRLLLVRPLRPPPAPSPLFAWPASNRSRPSSKLVAWSAAAKASNE
jgi:hypothetical protein